MREDVINYIKTLSLGTFSLSEELPRDDSGVTLYVKNPKTLYVDADQLEQNPVVQALDGFDLHNEETTVSVYFTADAKTLPANYSTLVNSLKLGKDVLPTGGFTNRTVEVQSEYEADLLSTRIDYTFSKLTT